MIQKSSVNILAVIRRMHIASKFSLQVYNGFNSDPWYDGVNVNFPA